MQEGSVWEAAMSVAQFQLTNLIWIINRNGLQLSGKVEEIMELAPLDQKLKTFGFDTVIVNGHDYGELLDVLQADRARPPARPLAVIADTVKGKGIPLIENKLGWHGRKPNDAEFKIIIEQLGLTPEEFAAI
jgi:transketolase